jgi:type IV secretory pathway VirB3-like protein
MAGLIEIDLPVPDTRPVLVMNVMPLKLALILGLAFGFIIIMIDFFFAIAVEIFIWLPITAMIWKAVKKDYHRPRQWFMWLATKAHALDSDRWGGSSPAPNPIRSRRPRSVIHASR